MKLGKLPFFFFLFAFVLNRKHTELRIISKFKYREKERKQKVPKRRLRFRTNKVPLVHPQASSPTFPKCSLSAGSLVEMMR